MQKRVVLLISGWTGRQFLWNPMAERFKAVGYDVITAKMPGHGFGSIEDTACRAAVLLSEVRRFYDQVIVIGHSMGGLVGRTIIQHLELAQIDAFVSLGTPHWGTYTAYLAPWSESACQMRPGSFFLKSLNEADWPENLPALALQASFDELVVPARNAKVPWATNRTVPFTNHVSIAFSEKTFLEIWSWLVSEVFGDNLQEMVTELQGGEAVIDLERKLPLGESSRMVVVDYES